MTIDYRKGEQLVELAALAAYHGDAFLRSKKGISQSGVEAYWTASRQRLNEWSTTLKDLECEAKKLAYNGQYGVDKDGVWRRTLPLIEEILSSEIFTRVWTAIGCEMDSRNETGEIEPFVRSVLVGHLETRHRLLRLVFNKLQLSPEQLRIVDKIRRRSERWNDVLLGYLAKCCRIDEFAFDVNRVVDFSSSLNHQAPTDETTHSLLLASLRSSFKTDFTGNCPNPVANENICEATLACLGSDIFECTGEFRSLWKLRLKLAAEDTQGMIDCLASEHD